MSKWKTEVETQTTLSNDRKERKTQQEWWQRRKEVKINEKWKTWFIVVALSSMRKCVPNCWTSTIFIPSSFYLISSSCCAPNEVLWKGTSSDYSEKDESQHDDSPHWLFPFSFNTWGQNSPTPPEQANLSDGRSPANPWTFRRFVSLFIRLSSSSWTSQPSSSKSSMVDRFFSPTVVFLNLFQTGTKLEHQKCFGDHISIEIFQFLQIKKNRIQLGKKHIETDFKIHLSC